MLDTDTTNKCTFTHHTTMELLRHTITIFTIGRRIITLKFLPLWACFFSTRVCVVCGHVPRLTMVMHGGTLTCRPTPTSTTTASAAMTTAYHWAIAGMKLRFNINVCITNPSRLVLTTSTFFTDFTSNVANRFWPWRQVSWSTVFSVFATACALSPLTTRSRVTPTIIRSRSIVMSAFLLFSPEK